MTDLLIYTLRPEGTSLWIPQSTAGALGVREGERLTPDQFQQKQVQELLAERQAAERKGERKLEL